MANIIDNLAVEQILETMGEGLFGSTYIAQTFVAEGDQMQSLEFLINGMGEADTKYHLLITTMVSTEVGSFEPGEVLAEIEGLVEPFDADTSLNLVHLDMNGLSLVKGQTYAFILDGVATTDGLLDYVEQGFNDDYAPGLVAITSATGLGRAADFKSDWLVRPDLDVAFKVVFSDAGETDTGTPTNGEKPVGASDNNIIIGTKKDDKKLIGTSDDDTIIGKAGKDKLKGKDGFDELIGGKHDDKLIGGNDDDILNGGKHHDILKGGPGKDGYVFDFKMTKKSAKKHWDTIKGFDAEEDTLYLKQDTFPSLPLGEHDGIPSGLTYNDGQLKYDGMKFAEFKGSQPAALEDITIVVYA